MINDSLQSALIWARMMNQRFGDLWFWKGDVGKNPLFQKYKDMSWEERREAMITDANNEIYYFYNKKS